MEGRLYRNAFYPTFKIKTQIKKKIGKVINVEKLEFGLVVVDFIRFPNPQMKLNLYLVTKYLD